MPILIGEGFNRVHDVQKNSIRESAMPRVDQAKLGEFL